MQLRALVVIVGIGFAHQPGAVFEMEDGPEADRLLKLRAAEKVKIADGAEAGTDDELLTDEEDAAIKKEFLKIDGMTDDLADALMNAEVQSLEALARCKVKSLYDVVGRENASAFVKAAKALVL